MNRYLTILAGILILVILAGCGGGVQQSSPRRDVPGVSGPNRSDSSAEPAAKATAEEFNYQGWQAVRMSNGLVTLVAVPEIGGRIMEYKLGGHPLLWVNPNELGQRYTPDEMADGTTYPDFGGYRTIPVPLDDSTTPADEVSSLDSGRWTHEILAARGRRTEVQMTSPPDKVTGLQITRTITMYAGTTNVRITEKITNISDAAVEYSIGHTSQVIGSLAADASFSPESRIYFPLNEDSKHKRRFAYINESGTEQFVPIDDNSLIEVSCLGQTGHIGADSMAGWVAHVDGINKYAFVQRFETHPLGDYPLQNSTVTVRTNSEHSCMELTVLSPLHKVSPGDTAQSSVDWYATRVGGPVREVTEVAAFSKRPSVTKTADEFQIAATFGVFAPGGLSVQLKDKDARPLGEELKLPVSVTETVELDKSLPVEKGATSLVLELRNEEGSPLGEAASVSVAPTIAKADTKAASTEPTAKPAAKASSQDSAGAKADAKPTADTQPPKPPAKLPSQDSAAAKADAKPSQ